MDTAPQASATDTGRHLVVVSLWDLDTGDLDLAGGKAANLGELIEAGFPIPDGFCVTTDA
jgi:pyruvate,water dikinase